MTKGFIVFLLFSLGLPGGLLAVNLDIRVFNSYEINAVDFKVISGKYVLETDEQIIQEFQKEAIINITPLRDSVLLQINHHNVGLFKEITLYGRGFVNVFELQTNVTKAPIRAYDDNLKVRVVDGLLQLVNNVDLENYVAGVVEAEGGSSSDNIEFYFVQAVSCRTYALVNYLKHTVDGHNLCDEVHCQYYLGRCRNPDVKRAVARTSGEVIVDSNYRMISAAFSSNCGGQTVNSEDIWSMPTSYLKSRPDTFCRSMSKATWQKAINRDDYLNQLNATFDFPINDSALVDSALTFKQDIRETTYVNGIPLKSMRSEFVLRSTFFEVSEQNNMVIISGRGFGHGVGLCQQGAIRMADLGYDYRSIVQFYYTGTHIVHYSTLNYNFMPQF